MPTEPQNLQNQRTPQRPTNGPPPPVHLQSAKVDGTSARPWLIGAATVTGAIITALVFMGVLGGRSKPSNPLAPSTVPTLPGGVTTVPPTEPATAPSPPVTSPSMSPGQPATVPTGSVNLTVYHSKPISQHPLPEQVGKWKKAQQSRTTNHGRIAVYRNADDDRDYNFFTYLIANESAPGHNADSLAGVYQSIQVASDNRVACGIAHDGTTGCFAKLDGGLAHIHFRLNKGSMADAEQRLRDFLDAA